jgi:hypothetical protein
VTREAVVHFNRRRVFIVHNTNIVISNGSPVSFPICYPPAGESSSRALPTVVSSQIV